MRIPLLRSNAAGLAIAVTLLASSGCGWHGMNSLPLPGTAGGGPGAFTIQAASRLGAEQSAKLCAQYLAPIIKNRQYNFPPIGLNPVVGTIARPNELSYSEDWMRPDYVPPQPPPTDAPGSADAAPAADATQAPLAAEAPAPPTPTNPATGLTGMMVPAGGGQ